MDNNFGRRINASLGDVKFCRDGDKFAVGSVATEDDFDYVSEGADAKSLI